MLTLTTLHTMTKRMLPGMFAAVLIALGGLHATPAAAEGRPTFSIVVHFEYRDGFEFDYVLERGVPASELGEALAECGRSHSTGSVVHYHCYPVPE